MKIQPFTTELALAVAEFNRRLLAGNGNPELVFPESPEPEKFPCQPGRGLFEEMFLAVDEGSVRGGFIIKHQEFWLGTEAASIAHYRLPVSEGAVNRRYVGVAMHMTRFALQKEPRLFALGMGGRQRPLPLLLEAMQWRLWEVPFYFFIQRPSRFLREIRALRSSVIRRVAMDTASVTGLGWLAARIWQFLSTKRAPAELTLEEIDGFADWADELWEDCKWHYSFLAARDSATLKLLYPKGSGRFLCHRVLQEGKPTGWFVALDTQMQDHKQFGNLRVGTIVDALARPDAAGAVIHAAADFLRSRGVELVISNQMHPAWGAALREAGFMAGPSNFILAVSPELKKSCADGEGIHMNRGDGDGPIHL